MDDQPARGDAPRAGREADTEGRPGPAGDVDVDDVDAEADPQRDDVDAEADPQRDDVDAREAERIRRRDHDAAAERRALMRPGMGKVFKQILDRQERDAGRPADRKARRHR